MLRDQSADRFARVMRPKIAGAWNLHRLTQQWPVQQFVLFSSAAALFGSPGQAATRRPTRSWTRSRHGAERRRLPALSIAWGLWSDVGAGSAQRYRPDRMAAASVGTITPEEGLTALARALAWPKPYVAVVPVNWTQLIARVGPSPFLSEVAPATVSEGDGLASASWATTSAEERQRLLTTLVQTEVARVSALQMHGHRSPEGLVRNGDGLADLPGTPQKARSEARLRSVVDGGVRSSDCGAAAQYLSSRVQPSTSAEPDGPAPQRTRGPQRRRRPIMVFPTSRSPSSV